MPGMTARKTWGDTVTLRLPPGVKQQTADAADRAGRTIGMYIRQALLRQLAADGDKNPS